MTGEHPKGARRTQDCNPQRRTIPIVGWLLLSGGWWITRTDTRLPAICAHPLNE